MSDRELLEKAAKAAGLDDAEYKDMEGWGEFRYGFSNAIWSPSLGEYWNPLVSDGDALRLVAKLNLDVRFSWYDDQTAVFVGGTWDNAPEAVHELFERDVTAATRLAIVRAAAACANWNRRAKPEHGEG